MQLPISMTKDLNLRLRAEVIKAINPYLAEMQGLSIEYIGYREFYSDGTSMGMCSREIWYDSILDADFITDMGIHYTQEMMLLERAGFNYVIRTAINANNRFLKELLKKDLCNSLIFYKKDKEVIRMFCFIASSSNTLALNYFFNKRYIFELIVSSCEEKITNIFLQQKYKELRIPLIEQKVIKILLEGKKKLNSREENHILTTREKECISLIAKGAGDKDIAKHFGISTRTVEYHIANIRKKLNVCNRFMIKQAAQLQYNL